MNDTMRVPIGVTCPTCKFNQVVLVELKRGHPEPEPENMMPDNPSTMDSHPGYQGMFRAMIPNHHFQQQHKFHRVEDLDPDEWRVGVTQELKECQECKNCFVVSGAVMIIPHVYKLNVVEN